MERKRFLQMLGIGVASAIIPSAFISKENTKLIDSECLKKPNKEKTLIQNIREDESFRLTSSCSSIFIRAAEHAEQKHEININDFIYKNICHCSAENEPHYHNKLS
ncbi:MAG: hypothetical protein WC886_08790 [Saccharofermentanaceae bacterium]|jgi:hypothetical protein